MATDNQMFIRKNRKSKRLIGQIVILIVGFFLKFLLVFLFDA